MFIAVAAALALAAPAFARPAAAPAPVEVLRPWSRPAVAGGTAVGYLTLVNRGGAPIALVKVQSPLARKAEIHRSSMTGGVMRMTPQPSVEVPAGGTVRFAPGGYHLMFVGLSKPLAPGDRLPATLSFSDGRQVHADFEVGSGAQPPQPGRR